MVPVTGGDRGGGSAPAHRRNLGPAHNNNQTLSKVIAVALQRNASGGITLGGRPTLPAPEGGSWGGSAPALSNNFSPLLGNNRMDPNPSESTPVDYEPSYSPTSWEGNEDAGAKDDRVPPAETSTRPFREAREAEEQVASWPQAERSVAGQGHRPTRFEPLVAFDPYGDGQALPKPSRKQLNKQILAEFDAAALDSIQGEADDFPYHGSIKARNALFLDTELRTGTVMVGFLLTAKVTTLVVVRGEPST